MIKISISNSNEKMGGAVKSFSFPPVITCSNCAECSKKCYAKRLSRFRPSVANAWENNFEAWKEAPAAVEAAILSACLTSAYFRLFVGGDFVDVDFLAAVVRIAKKAKNCKILAFTKKYQMVNDFFTTHKKPKNLIIIFSCWGTQEPENPHNLPKSNIIFKGNEAPANALICGGNCVNCICQGVGCWQLKQGQTIWFKEH